MVIYSADNKRRTKMSRADRLIEAIKLNAGEAVIIHNPSNMYYLSGYRGEGILLITNEKRAIITDFRYVEQAQNEAPAWEVKSISTGVSHMKLVKDGAGDVKKVYIEYECVTVKQFREMEALFEGAELLPLNNAPEKLRSIKDEGEIKIMEQACSISSEAFDYIITFIKEGLSEKEIRLALENKMYELGADALAFNSIIASGENGSLPHAIPSDRKVKKGDLITLDFGAKYKGYCADMTRTVALGKPTDKMAEIYSIVQEAQETCQNALAPGKVCKDIDAMARDIIGSRGYGEYFGHGLGHGVGIDIHEEPRLSPVCDETLQAGIVITVEPGIYLPGIGGVRIENTCLITESGAKSLVTAPRELIIL